MLLAIQEVVEDLFAFSIADFLQNDLFGRLRADTPEIDRFERLFEKVADFDFWILLDGVRQRDLMLFVQIVAVIDDFPASESLEITTFTVDHHPHIGFVMGALLGRRSERQLERTKDNVLGHVLFTGQHIHQQQDFAAHILITS